MFRSFLPFLRVLFPLSFRVLPREKPLFLEILLIYALVFSFGFWLLSLSGIFLLGVILFLLGCSGILYALSGSAVAIIRFRGKI